MASETPMPLLAIATPATRPHAAMPIAIGIASAAPSRNMGRREVATASARSDATQDLRDTLPSVEAGLSRETRAARFQKRDAAAGAPGPPPLRGRSWHHLAPAPVRMENAMAPKNTICLWYDGTALEAAQFY